MKRRPLLISLALGILFCAGLLLYLQRHHAREIYLGRHTRDWAWDLLAYPTGPNREAAVSALRALGSNAVPPLRRMLHTRDQPYERPIVEATRSLPPGQRRAILKQLRPGSAYATRMAAIEALGLLGPVAAPAIPDLVSGLLDPIAQIRWDSTRTLAAIGDAAIPALVAAANSTNAGVRQAAIFMLPDTPTRTSQVTNVVLGALLDPDENVRNSAIYAISRLGQDPIPMLKDALASADSATRLSAVRALTGLRPPVRLVLTNLLPVATNSTGELRQQTITALGVLRASQSNAVEVMLAALDDPDSETRVAAIKAVSEITWKTAGALPRLESFTRSTNPLERAAATAAMGRFGSRASNSVPALELRLEDDLPHVRMIATNALAQIRASKGAP